MEKEFDEQSRGATEGDEVTWVHDSSFDYKGRVPLRASTGVWKASLFVIVMEFSERLAYFGLSTNLIIYLTKVLHQEVETAAKNVNYWSGVSMLMTLIGGFLADSYFGRFPTVVISAVLYLMGIGILIMSQYVPDLKACGGAGDQKCEKPTGHHVFTFFAGMYLISVATGGYKPALESFGADQFDDDHPVERKKKMSYFNWWNLSICLGVFTGVTAFVYIQDNVGWGVADVATALIMSLMLALFISGRRFYRYRAPQGNTLNPIAQVLVAAFRKRRLRGPTDASELYEAGSPHKRLLCHTNKLTFLDKAAIIDKAHDIDNPNPWRLSPVTRVEETKLVLSTMPIWLSTLVFGVCVAQISTFFIKQGSLMDRRLARGFEIPPASLYALSALSMSASVAAYDRLLVPYLRRRLGSERGLTILQRISVGIAISAVAMACAAVVEKQRLDAVARAADARISVFWLAPQFLIMGVGDAFAIVGLQEFFYHEMPDSMRSLGIALYLSLFGVSSFISSGLITAVDRVTRAGGRRGWFGEDLNQSRIDRFYWLLVAMSVANLCAFVFFARRYTYKRVQKRVGGVGSAVAAEDSATACDGSVKCQGEGMA
ncbi:putative peptide/nitrate transporter [Acorus gramineus]|uniref:Peptide/nitrate transporter n=1 Tax=Acorus gramineus TaxID=55184 RepID=A0AAV9B4U0_ACOGR|nr:putative peptide/nitrate transporter [Acorus gramineus]